MNEKNVKELSFVANFIENLEINHEIASDCKLRSKFVHEKLFQSRSKESEHSVVLLISEKGVKLLRCTDQMLLSSHSIQRISYSACDRVNHLFAMVVRSSEYGKGHFCYIFRMEDGDQADSINHYFGAIFKKLHNRKKEKRSKSTHNILSQDTQRVDLNVEPPRMVEDSECGCSGLEGLDPRLRQISTSNIGELVSEKHTIRRLSLCMLTSSEVDDDLDLNNECQSLQSSLEKKNMPSLNSNMNALLRRKKPEYKGNRISAVIERLSFRSSREMSSDYLKSGSPVVALKEQLEYEEMFSVEKLPGFDGGRHNVPEIGGSTSSSKGAVPRKQLLPSHSNLHINNDSKAPRPPAYSSQENHQSPSTQLVRKNSAPIYAQVEDEEPPVPPVRIHSLRNTSFPKILSVGHPPSQLLRGCGEGASLRMPERRSDIDDDHDHLSSITTPSSCDDDHGNFMPVKFGIYSDPPPPPLPVSSRKYRDCHPQVKEVVPSSSTQQLVLGSNVSLQYFKDFSKEQAMDFLMDKEVGVFLLRYSASQYGCIALSVKVASNIVSHYIVHQTTCGFQMKGLDKTWPTIDALLTHLTVIPEMLPCPLILVTAQPPPHLPTSTSISSCDQRCLASSTSYFSGEVLSSKGDAKKKTNVTAKPLLPPQSLSADDEYQERMKYFLNDVSPPPPPPLAPSSSGQDQYQQLSDFSSIIAGLDFL